MTAGSVLTFIDRERKYVPMIVAECKAHGVTPSWAIAIARKESAFNPDALVDTGGDGARGGAYGLMQMTALTAKGLGFVGNPRDLLDADVNISYGVALIAQLAKYHKSFRDVAAAYNCGKQYSRAPRVTQKEYVPTVEKYQARYAALYDAPPVTS